MKIKNIDGKEYVWNLGKYIGKKRHDCSALHESAREWLKEKYPAAQILEEVHLPGINLYLDFYIPVQHLAIECQGIQHEKHSVFFHNTKRDFYAARANDRRKAEWCDLNRIHLVYFYPKETVKEWERKLNH